MAESWFIVNCKRSESDWGVINPDVNYPKIKHMQSMIDFGNSSNSYAGVIHKIVYRYRNSEKDKRE